MRLSIVIPFYNEEENVDRAVSELVGSFEAAAISYELVLVNNGSVDKTSAMLEEWAQKKPGNIKIIHVQVNQGYGWGMINGLKNTSGDVIGFMCGDGQIKPDDVIKIYRLLEQGKCDFAKARRIAREDGLWRTFASWGYNRLFRIMFNVPSKDINITPKIFPAKYLEKFQLVSKDWFIDAEIMIKAKYLNLKLGEVPVTFFRRERGKSNVRLSTVWEFACNMFRCKFGKEMRVWRQTFTK